MRSPPLTSSSMAVHSAASGLRYSFFLVAKSPCSGTAHCDASQLTTLRTLSAVLPSKAPLMTL